MGPFVLKKGPNRGIKCQFDILEKNPKGGPFYVENFSISDFTQVSCANFLGHKDTKHEIGENGDKQFFDLEVSPFWYFSDFQNSNF